MLSLFRPSGELETVKVTTTQPSIPFRNNALGYCGLTFITGLACSACSGICSSQDAMTDMGIIQSCIVAKRRSRRHIRLVRLPGVGSRVPVTGKLCQVQKFPTHSCCETPVQFAITEDEAGNYTVLTGVPCGYSCLRTTVNHTWRSCRNTENVLRRSQMTISVANTYSALSSSKRP